MSAWGEMRKRSSGELIRKEDKIIDLEYKRVLEDGINPEVWKCLYSIDPIYIVEDNKRDLIKEMDDFRWDGSRRPIRSGDYYIIDYLSEL